MTSPRTKGEKAGLGAHRITGEDTEFVGAVGSFDEKLNELLTAFYLVGRSSGAIYAVRDLQSLLQTTTIPTFVHNSHAIDPTRASGILTKETSSNTEVIDHFSEVSEVLYQIRDRMEDFQDHSGENHRFASSLSLLGDKFKQRASDLQVHREFGKEFLKLDKPITQFITIGIPSIKHDEEKDADNLLNMSGVATFFAGVTATTLQMSMSTPPAPASPLNLVNSLWIASLVFSIGAALNSFLARVWKQTTHGSRGKRLPTPLRIWIQVSPIAFLAASVLCFLAGLISFVYSTTQSQSTKVITIVTTALIFLGLLALCIMLAVERQIFPAYKRLKLKTTMNPEKPTQSSNLTRDVVSVTPEDGGEGGLQTIGAHKTQPSQRLPWWKRIITLLSKPQDPPSDVAIAQKAPQDVETAGPTLGQPPISPIRHFRDFARKLVIGSRAGNNFRLDGKQTQVAGLHGSSPMELLTSGDLKTKIPMVVEHAINATQPEEVRHVSFSPDGKFLAVIMNRPLMKISHARAVIYQTENYSEVAAFPNLQSPFLHENIIWSPNSQSLLIRSKKRLDVLCMHPHGATFFKRKHTIAGAAWSSENGDGRFDHSETMMVYKMDIHNGVIRAHYPFQGGQLQGVIAIPQRRLLMVLITTDLPPNIAAQEGFIPEKRVVTFDVSSNTTVDCVSFLLETPIQIDVAQNHQDVLISFEEGPPQLWTCEPTTFALSRRLIYEQPPNVQLTGSARFMGIHDQVVVGMSTTGNLYLWHKNDGTLIHRIKGTGERIQSFSGSPRDTHPFHFAVGQRTSCQIWSGSQIVKQGDSAEKSDDEEDGAISLYEEDQVGAKGVEGSHVPGYKETRPQFVQGSSRELEKRSVSSGT